MQVQVKIGFNQLLKIVKSLPTGKLRLLKAQIEKGEKEERPQIDLEQLLLNGPIASKKELKIIENNREFINQWQRK